MARGFPIAFFVALLTTSIFGTVDDEQTMREAASAGDLKAVEAALAGGADVNAASSSGGTALMYAAYGDHPAVVTYLLEAGASVDAGDRFGDPAINWAAYAGAAGTVDALLEGGADPTIVTHHGDALAIAMRRGFREIVESLVRHTGIETGDTALHRAARAGDRVELDRLLSRATVEVDAENRLCYTPLMEAAREGHSAPVSLLLEKGADPMHRGNALGMGMTALHLAADRDRAEVTRLLLESGIPVDAGNAQGTTPLAWALGEGSLEVSRVLLDAGADPAVEDENDFSALDMVDYIEDEDLRMRILKAVLPQPRSP